MQAWFADDEFWRDLYPVLFGHERVSAAPGEVEALLQLAGATEPRRVLDLCCGPGRHAIPLAGRGHEVVGVDHSAFLLERARLRAEELQVNVTWQQQDARDATLDTPVDVAICMYSSIGYYADEADNRRVLASLRRNLKDDGVAIVDTMGKEVIARILDPNRANVVRGDDGSYVFQHSQAIQDWQRIASSWVVVRGETAKTFRFDHRVYAAWELRESLRDVGFSSTEVYGSLSGDPYDAKSDRLVVVARA